MDIEKIKIFVDEFFEKRPSKDVFKQCLTELINEKHKIMLNEEYDKILIDKIDKAIESIQVYLIVATK